MIYRTFQDKKISALAFGTMRLPVTGGSNEIDEKAFASMVQYAIDNGVNYFDTAWGYHGGKSEEAVGRVLSRYPRNLYYLATKFPGYDNSNFGKHEEIFETQLKKCAVGYFDFYLLHNVCESNIELYIKHAESLRQYFSEQKRNGRIVHLGFSAHGSCETINSFLDFYGDMMEFCQLQLNYIDINYQEGRKKLEIMKQHEIPVFVMEPVRGGKLAKLDPQEEKQLKSLRPEDSIASWAFRYALSLEGVVTVLSGMSDMNQVRDNVMTFLDENAVSGEEAAMLESLGKRLYEKGGVSCTACRYCTSYCKKKLDIPELLRLYNEYIFTDGGFYAPMRVSAMKENETPFACVGCGLCEKVCPQNIGISTVMHEFAEKLKKHEY